MSYRVRIRLVSALRLGGSCRSIEFVECCIIGIVVKAQNGWRDVEPAAFKLQCIVIAAFCS